MTAVSLTVAAGVIYGLVKAGIYIVMQWFG
jgi:hypothetical protein